MTLNGTFDIYSTLYQYDVIAKIIVMFSNARILQTSLHHESEVVYNYNQEPALTNPRNQPAVHCLSYPITVYFITTF